VPEPGRGEFQLSRRGSFLYIQHHELVIRVFLGAGCEPPTWSQAEKAGRLLVSNTEESNSFFSLVQRERPKNPFVAAQRRYEPRAVVGECGCAVTPEGAELLSAFKFPDNGNAAELCRTQSGICRWVKADVHDCCVALNFLTARQSARRIQGVVARLAAGGRCIYRRAKKREDRGSHETSRCRNAGSPQPAAVAHPSSRILRLVGRSFRDRGRLLFLRQQRGPAPPRPNSTATAQNNRRRAPSDNALAARLATTGEICCEVAKRKVASTSAAETDSR